jgi:hypothetical protein
MLSLLVRSNASVPTPPSGYSTTFFSSDLGTPAYKDDTGVVHSLVGPIGPAGPAGSGTNIPIFLRGEDGEDGLMGPPASNIKQEVLIIACSDETTAITTGTAKVTFRMPFAMALSTIRASVTTAPTGSTIVIDVNEGGVSILSTKLSIDATEKTSTTAATPHVFSDSVLADDAEITIDFDQVGSTIAGTGVKVYLIGVRV